MFEAPDIIRDLIGTMIDEGGDLFSLKIVYRDSKGVRKLRYVSPTSWCDKPPTALWILCLTTGLTKKLLLSRVERAEPVPSHEMLIPMPQTVLQKTENSDDGVPCTSQGTDTCRAGW